MKQARGIDSRIQRISWHQSGNFYGTLLCVLFVFALIAPALLFHAAFAVTFGEAFIVSQTETSSVTAAMVVGSEGEVFIVWQESDAGTDVHFAASIDIDDGFTSPINFSEDLVVRSGAQIAITDDRIFVAWFENDDILVVNGTVDGNGNVDFGPPVNVSLNDGHSRNLQILGFGNSVYLVWEDDTDLSSTDIFYSFSAGGQAFSVPTNLSMTDGESIGPRIAISETQNVYVVWQDDDPNSVDGTAIFLRASTDGGITFGDHATVNTEEGAASNPEIVPSGSDEINLIWGDGNSAVDIHFSLGSVNVVDSSITFGDIVNISNNAGSSTSGQLAVSGAGIIYVAWIDDTAGGNDVRISNSTNGGEMFSFPAAITSDAGASDGTLQLVVLPENEEDLYLVWRDTNAGNGDIFLGEVKDNGSDIGTPTNLSGNSGNSNRPGIAAFGSDIYISWQDNTSGNNEILFLKVSSAAGEQPVIDIQQPINNSPKWGRIIEISGTTNGGEEDSVSIDWGDGSQETEATINDSSWGPVEHQYNGSHVGSNFVIAKLLNSNEDVKAESDPLEINVTKHETSLNLEDLSNVVVQGNNVTLSGTLTDVDDNVGISGALISFVGTGSPGLDNTLTQLGGGFSGVGPSPNSASTLWTLNAIFEGDARYQASSSSTRTFDTVSDDSANFTVVAGAPSILQLDAFNASITFDQILTQEILFVSECNTPENSRYEPMELCYVMSMTGTMPEGSFAHLTFTYADEMIPEGHSQEEVDIFHETIDGYLDITEARNTAEKTVTGRTSDFSRFVVAVAIHEVQKIDTLRKQLFVGQNDVTFNALIPRTITLDDSEYSVGSTVSVKVEDETVDDPDTIDTVMINVTSDSDPLGIRFAINETGTSTGTFVGVLTLSEDPSSSPNRILHVDPGDVISGVYSSSARGPIQIILDDVIESGMLELQTSTVDKNHVPDFDPISDAYALRLIDSRIANDSDITILMSYANVDLRNNEIISEDLFRVLQFDPTSPPSGAFEWFVITAGESGDVNTMKKTVMGQTNFFSNFTIGHDVRSSGPGGAGGGPVKSGVVVLDALASISGSDGGDNKNGNSGRRASQSTTIIPAYSGDDAETIVRTESGTITLRFESVNQENSQVKITSNEATAYKGYFNEVRKLTQDDNDHGIVQLYGTTYSTIGDVFDIDASLVRYEGKIHVTLPYSEDVVKLLGSEREVRFLHYSDLGYWEDKTAEVDEAHNTVTGLLDSLSPVIVAMIIDKASDIRDFEFVNSMFRLNMTVSEVTILEEGHIMLSTNLTNQRPFDQDYVLVVQVVDNFDLVQYLDWEAGSIRGNQNSQVSFSWNDMNNGLYEIQLILLTDMENPYLLSEAKYTDLII